MSKIDIKPKETRTFVSGRIKVEDKEFLAKHAKKKGTTLSDLVRIILEDYAAKNR